MQEILYPYVCSDVDYLTVTAKKGASSLELERLGSGLLHQASESGDALRVGSFFGYSGHLAKHCFVGHRHDGSIVRISGPKYAPLAGELIKASTNVSRIDFQVTIWTEGELPHLGLKAFSEAKAAQHGRGRPFQVDLVFGYPSGETCFLNKRASDLFGRIYDKSVESKLGEPRTIWRYELEVKGRMAQQLAHAWANAEDKTSYAWGRVNWFMTRKGVLMRSYPPPKIDNDKPCLTAPERDTLRWLQESVRITVGKQIRRHGVNAVVEALGLSYLL